MAAKQKLGHQPKAAHTVRIPKEWLEFLHAAQYIRGHSSMQELIMAVIGDFVDQLRDQEEIAAAMAARTAFVARVESPPIRIDESGSSSQQSKRASASGPAPANEGH